MRAAIEALWPDLKIELFVIKTMGDKIVDVPLAKVEERDCSSRKLRTLCWLAQWTWRFTV